MILGGNTNRENGEKNGEKTDFVTNFGYRYLRAPWELEDETTCVLKPWVRILAGITKLWKIFLRKKLQSTGCKQI